MKICRGSSIRKILVREAKSSFATELILGTATNHHAIKSSTSVAKYCAKKLAKDCSTLAVNNGKIVFQKETSSAPRFVAKGCYSTYKLGFKVFLAFTFSVKVFYIFISLSGVSFWLQKLNIIIGLV